MYNVLIANQKLLILVNLTLKMAAFHFGPAGAVMASYLFCINPIFIILVVFLLPCLNVPFIYQYVFFARLLYVESVPLTFLSW